MTYMSYDTCLCVVHVESETLIIKCIAHNTYSEGITTNRQKNLQFGSNPSIPQQNQINVNKQKLKGESKRSKYENDKHKRFNILINNVVTNKKLIDNLKQHKKIII